MNIREALVLIRRKLESSRAGKESRALRILLENIYLLQRRVERHAETEELLEQVRKVLAKTKEISPTIRELKELTRGHVEHGGES